MSSNIVEEKKRKMAEKMGNYSMRMKNFNLRLENESYGKFILQTNWVHFLLIILISQRTLFVNKTFRENLENKELGNLISHFRVCVKNEIEINLFDKLNNYNKHRNSLAHKMFSGKRLTKEVCEKTIDLGVEISNALTKLINTK
jgi:hypothetical protein